MRTTFDRSSKNPIWLKSGMIILSFLFVACLVYLGMLYHHIQKDKQTGFSETTELVLHDTDLTVIDQIKRYHGKTAYHVVFGHTGQNEDKIVFVPLTTDETNNDLIIIDQSEIISEERVQNQLQNECNTCKIISIIPGIEDDEILWEITYVDESDRYVLKYVSIYDAEPYEQFRFTQMYK